MPDHGLYGRVRGPEWRRDGISHPKGKKAGIAPTFPFHLERQYIRGRAVDCP